MAAPASNGSGTPRAKHTAALSSKILNMRFMQKAHERDLQQQLEEQQRMIDDESQWVLPSRDRMLAHANGANRHEAKRRRVIESETSYLPFTHTPVTGRQSFQNFSKQLEEEANKAEIPPEVDLPNMPRHAPTFRYMKPAADASTNKVKIGKERKVLLEGSAIDEEASKVADEEEHDSDNDIIQGARKKAMKRRAESVDSESTASSDVKKKRKKKKAAPNFIKPE